jgi:hypothetical protein
MESEKMMTKKWEIERKMTKREVVDACNDNRFSWNIAFRLQLTCFCTLGAVLSEPTLMQNRG